MMTSSAWTETARLPSTPGHRVSVVVKRAPYHHADALLLCTAETLGALVQRVRAHCRLRLAPRGARGACRHSITVFDAEGARLNADAYAALVRSRRAASWALTRVEVRVVVLHQAAPY
jgi:hypothetical protein